MCLRRVELIPLIARNAEFHFRWINSIYELREFRTAADRRGFLHDLIGFAACIEGLYFYGAFAYVYLLRPHGLLNGLASGCGAGAADLQHPRLNDQMADCGSALHNVTSSAARRCMAVPRCSARRRLSGRRWQLAMRPGTAKWPGLIATAWMACRLPAAASPAGACGKSCRFLFPGDLVHPVSRPTRSAPGPPMGSTPPWARWRPRSRAGVT